MGEKKYIPGERGYIIESNRYIREVIITQSAGGFCTIRFTDRDGGIRVRTSRLYSSVEEAEKVLHPDQPDPVQPDQEPDQEMQQAAPAFFEEAGYEDPFPERFSDVPQLWWEKHLRSGKK